MRFLNHSILILALSLFGYAAVSGNASEGTENKSIGFEWRLPKGFPEPLVPADNPMSAAKAELGRYLFYDKRMSSNGKQSCGTCHRQELAFTDGLPVGVGTTGEAHPRNSMGLVNIAYSATLTWQNPDLKQLEEQALGPMYGIHPVELGLKDGDKFISTLRKVPVYKSLFPKAFPGEADPVTVKNVTKAIACFERTIISARSPYDRYHYGGDDKAVSASAKHGEELFFSEKCACFHCHGGFNFSDNTVSKNSPKRVVEFHNNGLYNITGFYSFPAPNVGIYEYTGATSDIGKFKAPTLRNIAVTGPYMHDGSIKTLGEVIDHYAVGGRKITAGPNTGDGSKNPNKDGRVGGFPITPKYRTDLIAFLESLTDKEVLKDPRFRDPWPKNPSITKP